MGVAGSQHSGNTNTVPNAFSLIDHTNNNFLVDREQGPNCSGEQESKRAKKRQEMDGEVKLMLRDESILPENITQALPLRSLDPPQQEQQLQQPEERRKLQLRLLRLQQQQEEQPPSLPAETSEGKERQDSVIPPEIQEYHQPQEELAISSISHLDPIGSAVQQLQTQLQQRERYIVQQLERLQLHQQQQHRIQKKQTLTPPLDLILPHIKRNLSSIGRVSDLREEIRQLQLHSGGLTRNIKTLEGDVQKARMLVLHLADKVYGDTLSSFLPQQQQPLQQPAMLASTPQRSERKPLPRGGQTLPPP